MLDFDCGIYFLQADCLALMFGDFFNRLSDFLTGKKWDCTAGTNLVYKVHQVVNISSSGFGSNICNLFSPQTWNAFCVPGQDCFGSFFVVFFSLYSIFVSPLFFTSSFHTSSYSFSTLKSKKGEACEGRMSEVLGRYVVKEGRLSLPFLCLGIKTSVWATAVRLLVGVDHVVCLSFQFSLNQDTTPQHVKPWWKLW